MLLEYEEQLRLMELHGFPAEGCWSSHRDTGHARDKKHGRQVVSVQLIALAGADWARREQTHILIRETWWLTTAAEWRFFVVVVAQHWWDEWKAWNERPSSNLCNIGPFKDMLKTLLNYEILLWRHRRVNSTWVRQILLKWVKFSVWDVVYLNLVQSSGWFALSDAHSQR